MRFETVNEAAHAWVSEFNAFPQGMISKLMEVGPDDWQEITIPAIGNRIYVYDECECGRIIDVDEETDEYTIEMDSGKNLKLSQDEFNLDSDTYLPMWGTMWQFGDSADDWWIREADGLRTLCECGFRVYESEEFGYFFGIDGAGYDFYHEHWIPLYLARGLRWADEQYEEAA